MKGRYGGFRLSQPYAFYGGYRSDGWGAAAHDPQMMVALLLYASC